MREAIHGVQLAHRNNAGLVTSIPTDADSEKGGLGAVGVGYTSSHIAELLAQHTYTCNGGHI